MEPIQCRTCEKAFTPSQKGRPFCSRECYYESRRGPRKEGVKYRMRTAKGHPIAPPGGVVPVSRLVLWDKIGPGPHACHWCGEQVQWTKEGPFAPGALLADHLDWDPTNDASENLVPSCHSCNGHRRKNGQARIIKDGELKTLWGGYVTRAVERHCETCGSQFLTIPAEVKKGKGRFCCRSCARRAPRRPKPAPAE